MPDERLRNAMSTLQEVLADGSSLTAEDRTQLSTLHDDIELLLESKQPEQSQRVVSGLQAAVEHFEVEHPSATRVLASVMRTLHSMGI
jgi:hypothetical protein